MRYDLLWKCVPMDAIAGHGNWYDPYLGQGVYMLVVAKTDGNYIGYYVGKSDDIGRRWRQHVTEWFENPHEGYWIPKCADEFLNDPVAVFNDGEVRMGQGLCNRVDTQKQILGATWFCFAEVDGLPPWHTLENIEYVLQEALKCTLGICKPGHIGDTGRGRPLSELEIASHFGRSFLAHTLPPVIRFAPGATIDVK